MTSLPAKPSTRTSTRDLLLLLAIPLGLLLVAAVYAYLPKVLATPKYDFMFADCGTTWCDDSYRVTQDGGIQYKPPGENREYTSTSRLYYYDVQTDSTRAISAEETATIRLDASSRSPDGYVLEHEEGNGSVFLFFSSDEESGWKLQNGWLKKPVTLAESTRYGYNGGIQFLGWVK